MKNKHKMSYFKFSPVAMSNFNILNKKEHKDGVYTLIT